MAKMKQPARKSDDGLSARESQRLMAARHQHVAELHGESEVRNLTRWAKRAVLTSTGWRPGPQMREVLGK